VDQIVKGKKGLKISMLKEFKTFAMKGNMVDLAVGVIIGAAFGAIVASLVDDVFMPVIGLLLGGIDFSNMFILLKDEAAGSYATLTAAKEAGAVTMNIGLFINAIVKFVIVAFVIFLVVTGTNTKKRKEEAAPKAPPAPSKEEVLLGEIRDLLAKK